MGNPARKEEKTVEELLSGELSCRLDGQGRLLEAHYLREGKTYGFMLRCDPQRRTGSWKPEHGDEQFMEEYAGGKMQVFSSWHDGDQVAVPYKDWVDSHLADLRLRDLGVTRKRLGQIHKRKDWKPFCDLFDRWIRGMAAFDRFDPEIALWYAAALCKLGREKDAPLWFEATATTWLDAGKPKEASAALDAMAAALGKEAAREVLRDWFESRLKKHAAGSKKLAIALAGMSKLAKGLSSWDGEELLEFVLQGEKSDDPRMLEQRGFNYQEAGKLEEAADCYRRVLAAEPGNPRHRNNLVAIYLKQGKNEEAQQLMAPEGRKSKSGKSGKDRAPQGGMREQYGYHNNQACLFIGAGKFEQALKHSTAAYRLELKLTAKVRCDGICCTGFFPEAELLCHGTANHINVLNHLKRFGEARSIFESALADAELMDARVKRNSAAAERIWVSAFCTALDEGSDDFLAWGMALAPACQKLFPKPTQADLAYDLACLHARAGDTRRALVALRQALELGSSKSHAASDRDLQSLHGSREFEKLIG